MKKTIPDATKVARRALVLASVVCRGAIEEGVGNPDAEVLHPRLLTWMTELNLWDEAEPSEKKLLHTPLGQLEQKEQIQSVWYVEGLAVLAWSLRQFEFPPHDDEVHPNDVTDAVGFLGDDASEFINSARLRNRTQLNACLELMYAVHVRLRNFLRQRSSKNFTEWVELKWIEALRLKVTDLFVGNDLAIDNKPISEVDEKRVQACTDITFERHRAIIWLLEGHSKYSETPVDT